MINSKPRESQPPPPPPPPTTTTTTTTTTTITRTTAFSPKTWCSIQFMTSCGFCFFLGDLLEPAHKRSYVFSILESDPNLVHSLSLDPKTLFLEVLTFFKKPTKTSSLFLNDLTITPQNGEFSNSSQPVFWRAWRFVWFVCKQRHSSGRCGPPEVMVMVKVWL